MDITIIPLVIAAVFTGSTLGFVTAAMIAVPRIRTAEMRGWKACVQFYQFRENQDRETPRL